MGPPPSANQTFVYQQVSAQNFTPINSQPAPYDPNATLPRAHSGYVPAAAFSHQPGAVTPGGIYGQTAMSSVTPVGGSMYQTPMSAMSSVTPGQYSVMTPGSNISAYDPNASPGPMQSVPMLSASSGVHTPPRYPVHQYFDHMRGSPLMETVFQNFESSETYNCFEIFILLYLIPSSYKFSIQNLLIIDQNQIQLLILIFVRVENKIGLFAFRTCW